MPVYCGWDIGGVHLKLSRLTIDARERARISTSIEPFEIWRSAETLTDRVAGLLTRCGIDRGSDRRGGRAPGGVRHAVTMTAELSDRFASRSEGVRYILQACSEGLGSDSFRVFTLEGALVRPDQAMERPLRAAAANWVATAHLIAGHAGPSILIDVGSTTTDIIPIDRCGPVTTALDDTGRLHSGELVYTGALRTPPASLAEAVPLRGRFCRVASEQFCLMADVYLLRGRLGGPDYTVATVDGRGRSRGEAAARLARLVCADSRDLADDEVAAIAAYLEDRQIDLIARALAQVMERLPDASVRTIWSAGIGSFLAREAAERVGGESRSLGCLLPALVGDGWERAAPSAALAVLLAAESGDRVGGPA